MNKLTKGVIAAAAGVILLSGGAGTFAAWNDSSTLAAGQISTGKLAFETPLTAGSWFDVTASPAGTAIPDISAYKIVPGSKIEFRQNVTIDATGNNLIAKFGYTNPTITKSTVADANFTPAVAITGTLPTGVSSIAGGFYQIDPSLLTGGKVTIPLQLDITFLSATTGLTDQSSTIDFGQTALTLAQTAPTS